MVLKIAPRSVTWIADVIDHLTPDHLRSGDLFDVLSGRHALQAHARFDPFIEIADDVQTRRARAEDLTTSGLGFEMLIAHGSEFSNALVHLPAADHPAWKNGKMSVVIDAHGFTDSPRAHSKRSGFSQAAVDGGAIAVALGGSRGMKAMPVWLIRSHDGMNGPDGPLQSADGSPLVEFILENLQSKVAKFGAAHDLPEVTIDRDRTMAVGFSNGGALAAKLAAAGTVPWAISFCGPTSPQIRELQSDGPVNIIFVAGAHDTVVPPDGPSLKRHADFIAPDDAAALFATRNGSGALTKSRLPAFLAKLVQPGVEIRSAGNKKNGVVAVIHIDDNGHAVPGSQPMISTGADPMVGLGSSEKLSGATLVRDFLKYLR